MKARISHVIQRHPLRLFPRPIQDVISNYKILGIFPLDKILHVVAGMIITIVMRSFGLRMRWVILCLVILEIIKESIDSTVYTATGSEHAMDILATFAYPLLLFVIIQIKKKINRY